jgi:tetratricopeptide (TPR) repeat protein
VALLKLWIANDPASPTPVLRLAAYYYREQKPADVENLLNSLLAHRQSVPQADLLVGDFHATIRSWDKALADFQRGESLDREHASVYRERQASTLAAMGRRDQALKTLDAILAGDAKNLFARSLKAEILTRVGGAANLKTAAALAAGLTKDAPNNARIQMVAGQTFFAKGDLDSAAAAFAQAAKADPQAVAPHLALAELAVLRKNYSSVLENAGAALAIKPDDPTARLFRVIGLTGAGSYAQARTEAEQLAQSTKDAAPVEMQLGTIALREKNYAEAERHFQKVYREGDANPYPLEALVNAYIGEHETDRALQLAQTELKRTPDSGQKAALLVATAEAVGKPDIALAELEKLAARNPKSPDVQIRIGDVERRRGNLTAALQAFQRARALAPDRKGIDATIANIEDQAGLKTEAIASYRKALSQTPDDPVLLNNLAFLLTETGADLNEALRLATTASRKVPDSPAIEDTLAWIHIKRGNSAAMLPILNQLTRKDPANATYRYHYAVALLQKGDRAMAKQQLQAALSDKPAKSVETEIRGLLGQIQ